MEVKSRLSDAALIKLLVDMADDALDPEPACAVCSRVGCRDWCDGYELVVYPIQPRDVRQKAWECAHAWLQFAEYDLWISFVNRLHRSGPVGEMRIEQEIAWRDLCAEDEKRAWAALNPAL